MKMDPYTRGRHDGMRHAITWLHQEALRMNDLHARRLLNGAAMDLGSQLRNSAAPGGPPEITVAAPEPEDM